MLYCMCFELFPIISESLGVDCFVCNIFLNPTSVKYHPSALHSVYQDCRFVPSLLYV